MLAIVPFFCPFMAGVLVVTCFHGSDYRTKIYRKGVATPRR